MNLYAQGSTHMQSPHPQKYQRRILDPVENLHNVTVPKAERKGSFPVDVKADYKPGPGMYSLKRYFDNKQVVDYSKRNPSARSPRLPFPAS